MKPGDLIWQVRLPGGPCVLVKVIHEIIETNIKGWSRVDLPIFQILHPSEGLIEDASYYYETIKEAYERHASNK